MIVALVVESEDDTMHDSDEVAAYLKLPSWWRCQSAWSDEVNMGYENAKLSVESPEAMETQDDGEGQMKVANIQQESVSMKLTDAGIQATVERRCCRRGRRVDSDLPVRQVDLSGISQSLVTLAPSGAELNPKQQVMAEQFRLLRSRVKGLSKDFQLRTLLITSTLSGEGKTTVAANLAGSLSCVEGMRILLVDLTCVARTCIRFLGSRRIGVSRRGWRTKCRGSVPCTG